MNKNTNDKPSIGSILKFIIPSLIGVLFFMIPIKIEGQFTIPIAYLSNLFVDTTENFMPLFIVILVCISAIGGILTKILKPKNKIINTLFNTSNGWLVARIIGMILTVMTYFQVGPEFIISDATGGLILFDLLPLLVSVFLFAGLLLPLLLNHGLLEFVGALLTKFMRPVFKLPGRSSIDCITSWLGDGTIGILLTSRQYDQVPLE